MNGALAFVIRTADAPEPLIPAVRRAFRELNPSLPLEQFTTLDGLQAASLQSRRPPTSAARHPRGSHALHSG